MRGHVERDAKAIAESELREMARRYAGAYLVSVVSSEAELAETRLRDAALKYADAVRAKPKARPSVARARKR